MDQLPSVILIRFDNYTGLYFPGCPVGVVPIYPQTRTFEYKGTTCTRTQYPLRLGYAITVHKSQGLTLQRAVINLNQREHCLGLSYVAVLRVKTLSELLFDLLFNYDRFIGISSITSNARDNDYANRVAQII